MGRTGIFPAYAGLDLLTGGGDFIRSLIARYREVILYLFVGGMTFCVSYGSFTLLYNLLKWNYNAANVFSIIFAVLFAYVTNKLIVFRSHKDNLSALLREAASFFSARGVAMLFELVGLFLLCDVLLMNPNIGKLIVTFLVVIINYLLSKLFVFRKKG